MTSQTVAQEALPLAVGATYVGFLSQLPPDVVLGSFTGAVIFLLGVSNKPKWQWMLLFTVAFMTGILGGGVICNLVGALLGIVNLKSVVVPPGMGAMVAAATTINFLSWIRDNPNFFFRRGKDKETME